MSQASSYFANSGPGGFVQTLTTDDGHVVQPLGGTIIVHGTHGLNTTGTIGPNTVTIGINNSIVLGDLAAIPAGSPALTATTGDITISSGDLNMPFTSSANVGVINFGAIPWAHVWNDNMYVGFNAGNFTSNHFLGGRNSGFGEVTLFYLTTGHDNTAIGYGAISGNPTGITGSNNACVGANAGSDILAGNGNCVLGSSALTHGHPGNFNIAVGFEAAFNYTGGEDSNIIISNPGVATESHTIRIGTTGSGDQQQSTCFIAGIDAVDLSTANVVTEVSDQLGTAVLTPGAGISITPGVGVITIAATGGGVTSITGNTGAAQTGAINLVTASATPIFAGAAGTITLDFLLNNLFLGSSGSITSGNSNVGYGSLAAASITSGSSNSFLGYEAGVQYTTGSNSTAVGGFSMFNALAGASNNTAIGTISLYNLAGAGTGNISIGFNSGSAFTTTESDNIILGNTGIIADSGVIRIGTNGIQTSAFVAGVDGVNVGSVATVVTEAGDQLGTAVITAGAGISVTPGANTITIAASVKPAFGAYVNTSLSNVTGDATQYDIIFDSTFFNISSSYNTGTGIFTAPVTGIYHFQSTITLSGVGAAHINANFLIKGLALGATFEIANPFVITAFGGLTSLSGSITALVTSGSSMQMNIEVTGGTLTVGILGADAGQYFSQFSGYLVS